MYRIRRIRHSLARLAGPAGVAESQAGQLTGPQAPPLVRSSRDGPAARFIQDMAAAANVAVGQQRGRPGRGGGPAASKPRTTTASRRTRAAADLLPRTVQLCIHCRRNPAGFWVSQTGGQTVRRPWCLFCCRRLDRDHCHVVPFEG